MPIHNYFVFDGKSSLDFGVGISGSGTFRRSHRRVERFTVPGRNGTLTISDGTFEDVEIVYPAYFVDDFDRRYDALASWLLSKQGMLRLEDTYHPEQFRLAEFVGDIDPEMGTLNRSGKFELVFNCDGRKFLKSGDREYLYEKKDYNLTGYYKTGKTGLSVPVVNPTPFPSKPLIEVFAGGTTIEINNTRIQVAHVPGNKAIIDCDSCEAYDSETYESINQHLTVENDFPVLLPGENFAKCMLSDGSEDNPFGIIPRWYIV